MKYAWASITHNCTNYANKLIEDCLRSLLRINGEEYNFDSFSEMSDDVLKNVNECEFMIIPGCTTLEYGDWEDLDVESKRFYKKYKGYTGLKRISEIIIPKYDIGAAFSGGSDIPNLTIARNIYQPIGARDPFTHKYLIKNDIKSEFIGCPTLFSGNADSWTYKSGPIVVNLGTREIESQVKLIRELMRFSEVRFIVQEDKQKVIAKQLGIIHVDYQDINTILSEYRNASVVVTGRLHAALPSIAAGTPVVFLDTTGSRRFSLLDYLQLPMNSHNDPELYKMIYDISIGRKRLSENTYFKVRELKKRFKEYCDTVINSKT